MDEYTFKLTGLDAVPELLSALTYQDIRVLDLSDQEYVDDNFILTLLESKYPATAGLLSLNLTNTKITQMTLDRLGSDALIGTVRDFQSHNYLYSTYETRLKVILGPDQLPEVEHKFYRPFRGLTLSYRCTYNGQKLYSPTSNSIRFIDITRGS